MNVFKLEHKHVGVLTLRFQDEIVLDSGSIAG
jgi:hypothetical protein